MFLYDGDIQYVTFKDDMKELINHIRGFTIVDYIK